MTAMLESLIDGIEHSACENCQHPVNDQGAGGAWIHTLTGQYRCPPKIGVGGDGFAMPSPDQDAIEAAVEKACAETEEVTRAACEEVMYDDEQLDEATDKAYVKGRADYSAELNGAITSALHGFAKTLSPDQREAVDRMNEVLTEAWMSVEVST